MQHRAPTTINTRHEGSELISKDRVWSDRRSEGRGKGRRGLSRQQGTTNTTTHTLWSCPSNYSSSLDTSSLA
jgi:hypothetical protein